MKPDRYTDEQWAQIKRWVDNWKTLGPELERMREEENRNVRSGPCCSSNAADPMRSILGLYPYETKKGVGSTVILRLSSTPGTSVEAGYIRIEMCGWWIRKSGKELAHSESSDADIATAVSMLKRKRLNEINLFKCVVQNGVFHGAHFCFEDRTIMKVQQYEDSPAEYTIFAAHVPKGPRIYYKADGRILIY